MGCLIDTSIFIESERGRLDLLPYIAKRRDAEFFMSVITASELLHGVHRATLLSVQTKRAAIVEGMLQQFPILDVDITTARAHARLWADLKRSGQMIGPHDLWLAAACIAHGLTMISGNIREFDRVEGLAVEVWT